jgi:quercetin dioxygenase-like cupin family protein
MKRFVWLFLVLPAAASAQTAEGYLPQIRATPTLRTETTIAGQPIVYPKPDQPEVTALLVEIPPGAETGWHKHPFPAYGYILSGKLEVELEGGKVNHLKAGDAIAESVDLAHNGKNNGTESVKLIMFVTGAKDQAFTVKVPLP